MRHNVLAHRAYYAGAYAIYIPNCSVSYSLSGYLWLKHHILLVQLNGQYLSLTIIYVMQTYVIFLFLQVVQNVLKVQNSKHPVNLWWVNSQTSR